MKPDTYTKSLFAVVAFAFAVLSLRPLITPRAAIARSPRAGDTPSRYQLQQINDGPQAGTALTTVVFDTSTGQLWELITQKCGDHDHEQKGRVKMPGLGNNELPKITFTCR